jgi:amidase
VNGLVGLKTSRGRVSVAPMDSEISGLGVHGPLARTVRDAAALLDAMSGPTTSDWIWQGPPLSTFLEACDDEPKGLRIGRYMTPAVPEAVVHPDCQAAYQHTSALLERLGHHVEEHRTAFGPEVVALFEDLWSVEFASLPSPLELEGGLRPLTAWFRQRGRALSAVQIYAALGQLRARARDELERSSVFDAVLTPTLAQPPAKVGAIRDDADPVRDFENQKRFAPFSAPYNLTGQPALSLPLYWTEDEIPIGVQLVGRPGDEVTLLRLAAQLEAAAPWAHRKPACW